MNRNMLRRTAHLCRVLSAGVLNFVFPPVCLLCGTKHADTEKFLCTSCYRGLERNTGHALTSGDRLLKTKKYFSFIAWRFAYNDEVRNAVHHFKFNNYPSLYKLLGRELAETAQNRREIISDDMSADALVPVPLSRARYRERGYNQSYLLSRKVSEITGIPIVHAVDRIKYNKPQSKIADKKERFNNIRGVFAVNPDVEIKGKRLVLVDDIVTSGATVNECSKVLVKAGAREVMILAAVYAR